MSLNVQYQITHYGKRGKIKQRYTAKSRSFVKAFLQLLYIKMANLSQNVIDIDATSRALDNNNEADLYVLHPGLDAGEDSGLSSTSGLFSILVTDFRTNMYADDQGIQVGTSSTAVVVADDNLVTPIANGTGSGQLVYYGCYGLNYTTGATTASFDIEREFRNDSGGSITIAEIGLYCRSPLSGNGSGETSIFGFCIIRDVISSTVTVNTNEYLKVKYTITVSN